LLCPHPRAQKRVLHRLPLFSEIGGRSATYLPSRRQFNHNSRPAPSPLPQHCHPERSEGSAVAFETLNVALLSNRRQSIRIPLQGDVSFGSVTIQEHCLADKRHNQGMKFRGWQALLDGAEGTTMLRCSQRTKKRLLVLAFCALSYTMSGCVESAFTLSSDSGLPACIALPVGLTRKDVSVTLELYTPSHGNDVSFILKDLKGRELSRVRGSTMGSGASLYFNVHTDKGTDELIELRPYKSHETMEQSGRPVALFYVIEGANGEIYR